jgi:WD40 repeat protein
MINKYWMPLNSHALHVYFSALLSMPNCYLQRCYQSLQPQTSPQLITKRAEAWYHRDQVFEGQPNDRCGNFMCSPSGTHWASINTLGDVLVWDTWSETVVQQSPPDSQVIRHGQGYTDHALRPHFCSVAWSPDGEYVVTMDITGTVAVFCLQTRAIDYIFTSSEADLYRHIDTSQRVLGTESNCIAVSPDGQRVLLYSWDHLTWIETASGRVDQVQLCDLPILWRTSTLCITISQDSRHIAVAYVPNTTHIWDTQTGRLAYVLDCPLHCTSMLFSQHSRYFASLSHSHGIAVWDMTDTTYRAMIVPKRLPCSKSSIAFSWSEDLLSVPSSLHATAIEIWSLNTGQLIQTLEGYAVLYKVLSFTPAGQLVATFGDDQIRLMHPLNTDVASPRAAGLQGHSSAVEFLTLCENGDCLFCVSFCPGDGTLLMWNGYTGELMGTIDISPFLMVPMRNGEFPKPVTYNCSVDGRFVAIGMPSKDDITRTLGVADQDAHIDVIILVWDNLVGRFVKEATGRARCHWEIINVEQESPEVSGFTSSPDPESMPTYRHTHTVDILHPDDSGSIIVQGVTGCLQHFSSCKKMHQAQNLTQSCSLSARTWHDVLFVVLNNVCVDEISASPEPNNKDLTISAPLHIVGHDKLVHGYRLDSFWKMPDYNYLALSGDSISTEELKFKWTETLSFTPDLFNLQHAALLIDANSGWLICLLPSQRIGQARTRISLCWLPPELRSGKPVLQWSQKHQRVVIGAQTGIVTILDLSHFIRHYTTS